jgi:hypothetical protein
VAINHCGTVEAALETKRLIEVFACRASRGAPYITGQATFACGGVILFADFLTDWPSPSAEARSSARTAHRSAAPRR